MMLFHLQGELLIHKQFKIGKCMDSLNIEPQTFCGLIAIKKKRVTEQ